ncbi:phosphatidylserine decarboxylase [Salinisphaera orenii MK-B5]|uniref:Phosphatidylserine decarboxylase proenzyme n=1 Tax=Salinisphaera orenii MK-B5 TaxID=856730 RepID=A0A423PPB4_9GAMM|nr:archaetidylserine decarboxylase [Salinisphaera orenii]ROO27381.1 phosphatidylserine decarboxylase [Salinisphaera orenii MK-B5]
MSERTPASHADRLFAALFWLLPTRLISRGAHTLAGARAGWLRRALIAGFLRLYPAIDMTEAEEPDPQAYPSFNAFFTRALAPGQRPLPSDPETVVSPVDGTLGACGEAHRGTICQTKGMTYDLQTLMGGDEGWAAAFLGGRYATFYLAPHDYHRVHMPLDGCVRDMRYVPGRLFGVNPRCVRAIPRLFSRNERLVTLFDTAVGPMALIMVGAFIVGGIETRWAGTICPPHRRAPHRQPVAERDIDAAYHARGEEMGRFAIGSSVILLFGPGALEWPNTLAAGRSLRLGTPIGRLGTGA